MMFKGKALAGGGFLNEHGIKEGSCIILTLNMRGGGGIEVIATQRPSGTTIHVRVAGTNDTLMKLMQAIAGLLCDPSNYRILTVFGIKATDFDVETTKISHFVK